jgi:hypothetical protein
LDVQMVNLLEAAGLLLLPPEQIRRLAEAGILPGRCVQGEWIFRREVIVGWKQAQGKAHQQQRFQQAEQRLGGLGQAKVQAESTSTFDLSVIDELDPPEL